MRDSAAMNDASNSETKKEEEVVEQPPPNHHRDQAQTYLAQARALRQSLPPESNINSNDDDDDIPRTPRLPWSLPPSTWTDNDDDDVPMLEYRWYVDLGREPGSWMDPCWGASGRRLTMTLDVRCGFCLANNTNTSTEYVWQTAPYARLRNGFDRLSCVAGEVIVIEQPKKWLGNMVLPNRNERVRTTTTTTTTTTSSTSTVRFVIKVPDGKTEGDVVLPPGTELHFALPAFANGRSLRLSSKEGLVSVRQMGWHTGWFRSESRIVGTFRAVPLAQAQHRDGF